MEDTQFMGNYMIPGHGCTPEKWSVELFHPRVTLSHSRLLLCIYCEAKETQANRKKRARPVFGTPGFPMLGVEEPSRLATCLILQTVPQLKKRKKNSQTLKTPTVKPQNELFFRAFCAAPGGDARGGVAHLALVSQQQPPHSIAARPPASYLSACRESRGYRSAVTEVSQRSLKPQKTIEEYILQIDKALPNGEKALAGATSVELRIRITFPPHQNQCITHGEGTSVDTVFQIGSWEDG
ncbi:hypothetical protein E5288_WYG002056 [Bos mutus]|uniref:Uncharacterized protein n=1 Tax=Bos mutus TaxID=72004 RepID=A0A6B0RAP8_9CETA|nr:hypothetical protein [Bos mutus]